jgi:hypothetical protein
MTDETARSLARVLSSVACAQIECAAMQAANADRASRGEAPAYSEDAFRSLIDQNAIGYNTVVQDMRT